MALKGSVMDSSHGAQKLMTGGVLSALNEQNLIVAWVS